MPAGASARGQKLGLPVFSIQYRAHVAGHLLSRLDNNCR